MSFVNTIMIFVIIVLIFYIFYLRLNVNIVKKSKIAKKTNGGGEHIPKRIIQVWKTWTNKTPEMFKEYTISLKNMNPEFEYIFFKDREIDNFLLKHYPRYYKTYTKLPLNIQKVDFFRYVAMYHHGGFYFDLDITALEPLDELLEYKAVFPIDEHINKPMCSLKRFNKLCDKDQHFLLGQYGFACQPKDPFVKLLVETIHENIDVYIENYVPNSEDYVYKTTGPDFVTQLYVNYPKKDDIHILEYEKRQYFGKYAKHNFVGTWKNGG